MSNLDCLWKCSLNSRKHGGRGELIGWDDCRNKREGIQGGGQQPNGFTASYRFPNSQDLYRTVKADGLKSFHFSRMDSVPHPKPEATTDEREGAAMREVKKTTTTGKGWRSDGGGGGESDSRGGGSQRSSGHGERREFCQSLAACWCLKDELAGVTARSSLIITAVSSYLARCAEATPAVSPSHPAVSPSPRLPTENPRRPA